MEIVNIILIFVSLAFLLGFSSILYFYIKLLKKLEVQEKVLKKHYLKQARIEAGEIVEEAGQEAIDILTASRTISDKDQTILDDVVKKIAQDQSAFLKESVTQLMQEFKTELQKVKNDNINTLTNVSKDIESNTSTELNDFIKVIEKETVASEKQVSKKIDDEYKIVQSEIETYKQEQIKRIDTSIDELIKKISLEVLEKSITPADHKDIILQNLEKAKSENLFTN